MPDGDVTINITLTDKFPDQSNAKLGWLGASAGTVTQGDPQDDYAYMVTVPHDFTGDFSIYAQAENPYLEPVLKEGTVETELGGNLTLTEGLNAYTITVTPEEGGAKVYSIKVIKLPDLSLKTFKIKKDGDFERDLAPSDTLDVYVPYADGITAVAEANDTGATTNSPVSANNLQVTVSTPITVTVSKTLSGVEASLTRKDYILNLYYGDDVPLNSLAEGGYVSFVPGNNGANSYDEVHTFLAGNTSAGGQAAHSLVFKDGPRPATVQVLVAAGGGGGGGSMGGQHSSSGGGAGRFVYHPAFKVGAEENWTSAGTISVKVGAGGSGGVGGEHAANGSNGGASEFVRHTDDYRISAPGGGGGHGNSGSTGSGIKGGSSGGSHNSANPITSTTAGTFPLGEGVLDLGNGGGGKDRPPYYTGGGAGGIGIGTQSAISGVSTMYAAGGKGGSGYNFNDAAKDRGNGGDGGYTASHAGGKGGSGIVIVRFPHPGNESAPE
ncbi:MAG: hypothetical protein LBK66_12155 [Spirochaetaceae bacterium]|jgi:hypothetical protein|nr:hypothetical protein [Spirochaetaceae bacterium]